MYSNRLVCLMKSSLTMISNSQPTRYSDLWEIGEFPSLSMTLAIAFYNQNGVWSRSNSWNRFFTWSFTYYLRCWYLAPWFSQHAWLLSLITVICLKFKVSCPPLCSPHTHATEKIEKHKVLDLFRAKRGRQWDNEIKEGRTPWFDNALTMV